MSERLWGFYDRDSYNYIFLREHDINLNKFCWKIEQKNVCPAPRSSGELRYYTQKEIIDCGQAVEEDCLYSLVLLHRPGRALNHTIKYKALICVDD